MMHWMVPMPIATSFRPLEKPPPQRIELRSSRRFQGRETGKDRISHGGASRGFAAHDCSAFGQSRRKCLAPPFRCRHHRTSSPQSRLDRRMMSREIAATESRSACVSGLSAASKRMDGMGMETAERPEAASRNAIPKAQIPGECSSASIAIPHWRISEICRRGPPLQPASPA